MGVSFLNLVEGHRAVDCHRKMREGVTNKTQSRYEKDCTRSLEDLLNPPTEIKSPKGWKPFTLGPAFLLGIASITLSLLVVIAYLLSMTNKENGALYIRDEIGPKTTFLFLYLPIVLSVFYSITWSWIDLDTKRLEPYFQMSRDGGARPQDSLHLHYPFDFVAVAPLKALKKR